MDGNVEKMFKIIGERINFRRKQLMNMEKQNKHKRSESFMYSSYSQRVLASALGVSEYTFRCYEKGTTKLSVEMLLKISYILQVNPCYFFVDEENYKNAFHISLRDFILDRVD